MDLKGVYRRGLSRRCRRSQSKDEHKEIVPRSTKLLPKMLPREGWLL